MAAAAIRQSEHHVPITIGWMTIKVMETTPSGAIINPNSRTRRGMVRQRRRAPTMPVRISST